MTRCYEAMRSVLAVTVAKGGPARYGDLYSAIQNDDALRAELARLDRDGLIDNGIRFQGGSGYCMGGEATVTVEGREFFSLVENERVWAIVLQTLESAGVDVPYPLLKEVCGEIVKRYVTSFIPDVKPRR